MRLLLLLRAYARFPLIDACAGHRVCLRLLMLSLLCALRLSPERFQLTIPPNLFLMDLPLQRFLLTVGAPLCALLIQELTPE